MLGPHLPVKFLYSLQDARHACLMFGACVSIEIVLYSVCVAVLKNSDTTRSVHHFPISNQNHLLTYLLNYFTSRSLGARYYSLSQVSTDMWLVASGQRRPEVVSLVELSQRRAMEKRMQFPSLCSRSGPFAITWQGHSSKNDSGFVNRGRD